MIMAVVVSVICDRMEMIMAAAPYLVSRTVIIITLIISHYEDGSAVEDCVLSIIRLSIIEAVCYESVIRCEEYIESEG